MFQQSSGTGVSEAGSLRALASVATAMLMAARPYAISGICASEGLSGFCEGKFELLATTTAAADNDDDDSSPSNSACSVSTDPAALAQAVSAWKALFACRECSKYDLNATNFSTARGSSRVCVELPVSNADASSDPHCSVSLACSRCLQCPAVRLAAAAACGKARGKFSCSR